MKKVQKSWAAVLLGALLIATLVGVVWAAPDSRPRAAVKTKKITIPAGWFHPNQDGHNWTNVGEYITSHDTYPATFLAPVVFPSSGQKFTVEKMALYAYDENDDLVGGDVCATLFRTNPVQGNEVFMGYVCSSGSSPTDPRTFTETSFNYNPVTTARGAYLQLYIPDNTNLKVYGVRIWYHAGKP